MGETEVGTVTHWYGHISVAGVDLSGKLTVGDRIRVKGQTTDFETLVSSIQIEHESVEAAGAGVAVGIRLDQRARIHDRVYRVE